MSTRAFHINDTVMYKGMASELFNVNGIDTEKKQLLLYGDWSQYGYSPNSCWVDMSDVFHTKLVIDLP